MEISVREITHGSVVSQLGVHFIFISERERERGILSKASRRLQRALKEWATASG